MSLSASAITKLAKITAECPRFTFEPYPWQERFIRGTADHLQNYILSGNQVGKSVIAGFLYACHLTGWYPDWWSGRRFEKSVNMLVCGISSESLRDVMQPKILGSMNENGELDASGFVHPLEVRNVLRSPQTRLGIRDATVRHKSGGYSRLMFRSYSQGQLVIAGTTLDVVGVDEEPEHHSDIFISQATVRLIAGGDHGEGGIFIGTFTPESGLTNLVRQLLEDRTEAQALTRAGWDDAPHLTEEIKADMLRVIPPFQHKMRRDGEPVFAGSMVYPIAEEAITCDPFDIPSHWGRICAIDFGIAHATAVVWVAVDRQTKRKYVYDVYAQEGEVPAIHAAAIRSRGDWIPRVHPHDLDTMEKGSGQTLAQHYRNAGLEFNLKFQNEDGTNHVEPGIQQILTWMREGDLKIFNTCQPLLSELRRYRRKVTSKADIVKEADDCADAFRYAVIMADRFNQTKAEAGTSIEDQYEPLYTE